MEVPNNTEMDPARKAFYSFHSSLMEPWDGPAAVCFTDGSLIGATLDRNGLRPGRYWVSDDGLVVFASEAGVIDIPQSKVIAKGRLQPGRMLLIDFEAGRIIDDAEIKQRLAAEQQSIQGEQALLQAQLLDTIQQQIDAIAL